MSNNIQNPPKGYQPVRGGAYKSSKDGTTDPSQNKDNSQRNFDPIGKLINKSPAVRRINNNSNNNSIQKNTRSKKSIDKKEKVKSLKTDSAYLKRKFFDASGHIKGDIFVFKNHKKFWELEKRNNVDISIVSGGRLQVAGEDVVSLKKKIDQKIFEMEIELSNKENNEMSEIAFIERIISSIKIMKTYGQDYLIVPPKDYSYLSNYGGHGTKSNGMWKIDGEQLEELAKRLSERENILLTRNFIVPDKYKLS